MDTLRTGFYTPELAKQIVLGLLPPSPVSGMASGMVSGGSSGSTSPPVLTPKQFRKLRAKQSDSVAFSQLVLDILDPKPVGAKVSSSKLLSPTASTSLLEPFQDHRPRIVQSSLDFQSCVGLVARSISKRDPEYNSPKVKAATFSQVTTLINTGVWELIPREWQHVKNDAKRVGEEVLMGRCHGIVTVYRNPVSMLDTSSLLCQKRWFWHPIHGFLSGHLASPRHLCETKMPFWRLRQLIECQLDHQSSKPKPVLFFAVEIF